MKKIISFSFWILIISCSQKQETNQENRLPFYHTADFTPQWISDKSQLDTLHSLANFEFTNQNNQKITQENLRGKIHVACFFFTLCPSLCPKIMGNMKVVQDSFQHDKNFIIASYSVMPDRDSVPMLRSYATKNQIIDNKWHLLTGDKKQIYQLARKSYFADENLGVQKGENDFLHTENFILVDKNLRIRGIYNGTLSLEIEQLIKDIRVLQKE
ncbi:MAG: SCO family protein [Arcicella sp.]|nr:SCO family protein [Arcicella sp.]